MYVSNGVFYFRQTMLGVLLRLHCLRLKSAKNRGLGKKVLRPWSHNLKKVHGYRESLPVAIRDTNARHSTMSCCPGSKANILIISTGPWRKASVCFLNLLSSVFNGHNSIVSYVHMYCQ
jgi:hypothetical protein